MLPGLVSPRWRARRCVLGAAGGVMVAAGGDRARRARRAARRRRRRRRRRHRAVRAGRAARALARTTPPRLRELLFGDLLGVTARRPGSSAAALAAGVALALALGAPPARARARSTAPPRARSAPAPGAGSSRCWSCSRSPRSPPCSGLGNLLLVALVLAPGAAALQLAAPAAGGARAGRRRWPRSPGVAGLLALLPPRGRRRRVGRARAVCFAAIGGGVRGLSRRYSA